MCSASLFLIQNMCQSESCPCYLAPIAAMMKCYDEVTLPHTFCFHSKTAIASTCICIPILPILVGMPALLQYDTHHEKTDVKVFVVVILIEGLAG